MTGQLSVGMLTPAFWPEVRRGTERAVHELSAGLIARGHRVRVITSHPGLVERGEEEGVPVLRVPRFADARLRQRGFEDYLTHVPFAYAALRTGRYDVAHAWFTTDALAAARWRRVTGRPALHSYMGIPDHDGLMWKRRRLEITLRAIESTDVTVALSRYVADEFRRWLGYDPEVIEPPVDTETFRPGPERSADPTVVCAATHDPGDDRKRIDLLLAAWTHVRRARPAATLQLDRPRDPSLAAALAEIEGVEIVAMDDRHELARLYASAWASALPARNEAFGLVLAEAMACGTPGVGANLHGIPEVIDSPEVGRLFDGDDPAEVARAVLEAFELAEDPATADACRRRALRLSRESRAEAYERLYLELLERRA